MDFDNESPDLSSAHVIVVGNEKGGAGQVDAVDPPRRRADEGSATVACIDLDTRQQT